MAQVDDNFDVVKLFVGVMGLMTVFVAALAIVQIVEAQNLREDVGYLQVDYESIRKIAGDAKFRELQAQHYATEAQRDTSSRDLGDYIRQQAAAAGLELADFERVDSGGRSTQRAYLKNSVKFAIHRQPLEVIVTYLWYMQADWAGLKVEKLSIRETRRKKDDPFDYWSATVTLSAFRPKPQ